MPLSIYQPENQVISVIPNPVRDKIRIVADMPDLRAALYDVSGRFLLHTRQDEISLSDYSSGIYLLHIYNGEKRVSVIKIVKQ